MCRLHHLFVISSNMIKRLKMIKRFNAKQIIILCMLLTVLICARYTYKWTKVNTFVLVMKKSDSIECHDEVEGDALPSVEYQGFAPPNGSIFFHETSCNGLNSRQACSVESAARAHPERRVYVLFSGPITNYTLQHSVLASLRSLRNIHYARVHTAQFVKGTPLETLVDRNIIVLSPWRVEHTADILRFVTLSKWGGIYLDTDMIVVKNLGPLGTNWVAREDTIQVHTAAMAMSNDELANNVSRDILREMAESYTPFRWGWNGPGALTRVFSKRCSTPVVDLWSAEKCGGFQVYEKNLIFPIHYSHADLYFEPDAELGNIDTNQAYTHHIWNRMTNDIEVQENTLYEKLAKEFCPTVFNSYREHFGS